MIETKDALKRHEVVGLLEEAIYGVEHYLGNCYLVDQLSELAYRIAQGEACFVEDTSVEERERERQSGIVEAMLDAYEDMMREVITQSHFKNLISDLSDDEIWFIIETLWFSKGERVDKEIMRSEQELERLDEWKTYTHVAADDEKLVFRDDLRSPLTPLVSHRTGVTPTTREQISEGLKKGVLALNLLAELFEEERVEHDRRNRT
jgi:hypothetical protein